MQKEAKLLFLQGSFKNITFLGWQVAQKAVRLFSFLLFIFLYSLFGRIGKNFLRVFSQLLLQTTVTSTSCTSWTH